MTMANADRRSDLLRVIVHRISDRRGGYQFIATANGYTLCISRNPSRGRRQFLVTMAGKQLCFSENPIVCSAAALFNAGYDPETKIMSRTAPRR